MLEHDWVFVKQRITHTLEEICQAMDDNNLIHFRFNKRKNIEHSWDTSLIEKKGKVPYCLSPNLSNNPHIINRQLYISVALDKIKLLKNSKGIEEVLLKEKDLYGAIYGSKHFDNTIIHLDGRKTNE
jgi:hypothetical protein